MSASPTSRLLSPALAIVMAVALLWAAAAPAAATDVQDGYELTLAPGGEAADELRVGVPADLADPSVTWRAAVAGEGCKGFTVGLVDAAGATGLVLTGLTAGDDGRVPVGVRVLAADRQGPAAPGSHACALRLRPRGPAVEDAAERVQVVTITLHVAGPATTAPAVTTTVAPATVPAAAAATTLPEEDTTTSSTLAPTTTTGAVAAGSPSAAGVGGGGGPPQAGPRPLFVAAVVVGLGLLLLGGGILATGRAPERPAPGARPVQPPPAR